MALLKVQVWKCCNPAHTQPFISTGYIHTSRFCWLLGHFFPTVLCFLPYLWEQSNHTLSSLRAKWSQTGSTWTLIWSDCSEKAIWPSTDLTAGSERKLLCILCVFFVEPNHRVQTELKQRVTVTGNETYMYNCLIIYLAQTLLCLCWWDFCDVYVQLVCLLFFSIVVILTNVWKSSVSTFFSPTLPSTKVIFLQPCLR